MCGIAGYLDLRRRDSRETMERTAFELAQAVCHRGPDDHGVWVDEAAGVALGHRRLSILDLSAGGHQPMVSSGGRWVLSYNGEIYNFGELRQRLLTEGHRFSGRSDTEVLLAACERWGLARALDRINGMFAFALWDRERRELHLCRDRLGEKPLYYGWMGDVLLFGSELKTLQAHPDFEAEVDRDVLALYLRHNCVPAPHSIYRGVGKLPPGTVLTVAAAGAAGRSAVPEPYWSARAVAESGLADPLDASPSEVVDELDRLLRDAVALRMQADVPLGAFLSGGVDSSTVVALMQAQSERRVKTFTIGFEDVGYDEAGDAARVAHHLGTDHVELSLSPAHAMEVIPRLSALYDEPFGDSSQIPTFLVSELARREVTVSLSGDGGDELFAGYNRYAWCRPIWDRVRRVPSPVRRAVGGALTRLSPRTWDEVFAKAGRVLPPRLRVRMPGAKVHKIASLLAGDGIEDMYVDLVSYCKRPDAVVRGAREAPSLLTDRGGWASVGDPVEQMMFLDLVTYLTDDILVKLDRASMGVSLEARVPMLDPRIVEFAWRVPLALKLRNGQGKWPLRQVLYRYVPPELVERPKMGFGLPIGHWLRGPLRGWVEELLDERRLLDDGFFEPAAVRGTWAEHLAGDRDNQDQLWGLLMFQAWLDDSTRRTKTGSSRAGR
ncbi:MAG TPA: asparagine synthase (glutamine-hydrolyzing) [Acidimicrobiales bacterium]|nr:asparagine synthase (glutamine-hydrolyzing) [Acidimicrobiales bacterium]